MKTEKGLYPWQDGRPHGQTSAGGSDSAALAGYVRPIPEALYPCVHCAEDHSWPATDLNWSDVDQGWVCDLCWDDRESNWDGEDYIEKDKGISLAEEIKRQRHT